jgi:Flp pilus assembly protein TadD
MALATAASLALALAAGPACAREAATPSECQSRGQQPAIATLSAKTAHNPDDLRAQVALADAWSDAGCYNEAVGVLQSAAGAHPESAELQTRLRIAKSLVGEEHFFDDLERADLQAKVKRDVFRCENLSDLDACGEAVRLKPDDAALRSALAAASLRAERPAGALPASNSTPAPVGGGRLTKTRLTRLSARPARRHYSNVSPDGQSH